LLRDFKLRPICALTQDLPMLVSKLINGATKTWNKQLLNEHLIAPDIHLEIGTYLVPDGKNEMQEEHDNYGRLFNL
jgi:hypothetical protein